MPEKPRAWEPRLERTRPGFDGGQPAQGARIALAAVLLAAIFPVTMFPVAVRAGDCDGNGVEDSKDIAAGIREDCNANGIPDACELVPVAFAYRGQAVAVGEAPRATVIADLNGDGRSDVATANQDPFRASSVSIVLASPEGGFREAVDHSAARSATSISAGDLDGDGDLDLATAHSSELQLFLNNGDGTFVEPLSVAVARFTRFVLVVDVDADGQDDLVTSNTTTDEVAVLLRKGPAEFSPPVGYLAGDQPTGVGAADVDGDGHLDLISTNRDTSDLSIFLGAGDGGFSLPRQVPLAEAPQQAAVGDCDGDGDLDLVVVLGTGFTLLLNSGDGTFVESVFFEGAARRLELGDIDDDGDLDFVVAAGDSRRTLIYLNPGDGAYQFATSFAFETRATAVGDPDGDGDLDLILTHDDPPRLEFLWNGESGAVPFTSELYRTLGPSHGHTIGDLDGDGDLDVAAVNGPARSMSVLFNRGDGTFPGPVIYEDIDPQHVHYVCAQDFDQDGDVDLAVLGRGSGQVWILPNAGDGTFPEKISYEVGTTPFFAVSRDIDGDGDLDLVTAITGDNAVAILFNDGAAGFDEREELAVGAGPFGVDVGDLDGDGDLDVISANATASSLSFVRRLEGGTFAEAVEIPASGRPAFVRLGDFDRDGDLDAVTANQGENFDPRVDFPGDLSVFLNRGDGSFEAETILPFGHLPWSVLAVDLDADGFLDLVSPSQQASVIGIFPGRGDGTFAAPIIFQSGNAPRFVFSGDLDRDGTADLVTSDRLGGTITVFLNRSATVAFEGDFLPTVCTELDFHEISRPAAVSAAWDREGIYLLPVRDDPALLPTMFPNSRRFADLGTFLGEVFPERFPSPPDGLQGGIERRASREYFAGGVRKVSSDDGDVLYGIDILTDPADTSELLEREEVATVLDRLQVSFRLPVLGYAPVTRAAQERAATWGDAGFPIVILSHGEEPTPEMMPEPTPTFELEVPSETTLCGVFQEGTTRRGAREELALKCRVRLAGGVFPLPTVEPMFETELIEEVLFGPTGEVAEAQGPGVFRMLRIPGEVSSYRFTYAKPFVLSDGRSLVVEIPAPLTYRARGDEPLERRRGLAAQTFVALAGSEAVQATLDGEPLVHLGSCSYETLPRWLVRADLVGGGFVELEERFEEAQSENDTAPASIARARVVLGGVEQNVADYFDLVYSARRHNTFPEYWIVLDPPLEIAGLTAPVGLVALRAPHAPERPRAEASYLSEALEPLATVAVEAFSRLPLAVARFRRGDVSEDGGLDINDSLLSLRHIFLREALACRAAADANADGRLNVLDPLTVLTVLFGARATLPAPFPDCGEENVETGLSCDSGTGCP